MKISVITVCYNSASTLRDTLESVLKQNYPDIEHIIVDGKSTDGTIELIRQYETLYQGKLKWISEQDAGIYDAMNKGISLATGDVIGFLNADDYYQDNKVLEEIAVVFNQTDIDAIHGNLSYINTNRKVFRTWQGRPYAPGAFQKGWMPAHPTFYCKQKCFEKFGVFDPSIGSAADFELMLRFIEKWNIKTKYIDRHMVYMRIGGSSTKGLRAILRNTRENRQAFFVMKFFVLGTIALVGSSISFIPLRIPSRTHFVYLSSFIFYEYCYRRYWVCRFGYGHLFCRNRK